jgi:UDP-GlcNAc:undecaprenyl-phosphate/decaprenyl-phosphate GlcNAc-1-phosphate transferase
MMVALPPALLALLLTIALTPLVRRLAFLCGATDVPDARRIHKRLTARAGGFGVAVAAVVAMALRGVLPENLSPWVLAGGALLLAIGLVDDVLSMSAHTKLLGQVMAAVLAVVGGLRLPLFGYSPEGVMIVVQIAVTVGWIVLVTNALNLTDGLDGLASGIGVMCFLALAAAALRAGDAVAATPALVLAAALVGFLVYNFNPASIFLGDTGSLIIGYAMAVLPLVGSHGQALPPLAAFLLVGLPVTDTMLAIARRFVSRCLRTWGDGQFVAGLVEGLKNTVAPDRRHIHHRLIDLGFTQRRAVLLLYVGAASTSALAYLVARSPSWPIDLFALGLGVAVIGLVRALGIDELQPARSDLYRPVLRRLARHRWLQVAADSCLIVAAYTSAIMVTGHSGGGVIAFGIGITMYAACLFPTFVALGVYRTAWWATGASGFGLLLQACSAGTVGSYVVLRVLEQPTSPITALAFFFMLLPAITVLRYSYVFLAHSARQGTSERALICGTATDARHALRRLRRDGLDGVEPIGFVEFSPRMQGRELGRLPVLGTLDSLAGIVREQHVKHLVIADPKLPGEALTWVRAVCQQLGVHVHRYVEKLVPYDLLRPATEAITQNGNGNASQVAWQTSPRTVDAPRS